MSAKNGYNSPFPSMASRFPRSCSSSMTCLTLIGVNATPMRVPATLPGVALNAQIGSCARLFHIAVESRLQPARSSRARRAPSCNYSSHVGLVAGGRERFERTRRADAAGFDLPGVFFPPAPAVFLQIAGPRKAIGGDFVVADPPHDRVAGHDAEFLLDANFPTCFRGGADVLQAVASVHPDEFPPVERRVERTQRRRHVKRLTFVADQPVLVENLTLGESNGAPVALPLPPLLARGSELPVAKEIVEVAGVRVVVRLELFWRPRWRLRGGR